MAPPRRVSRTTTKKPTDSTQQAPPQQQVVPVSDAVAATARLVAEETTDQPVPEPVAAPADAQAPAQSPQAAPEALDDPPTPEDVNGQATDAQRPVQPIETPRATKPEQPANEPPKQDLPADTGAKQPRVGQPVNAKPSQLDEDGDTETAADQRVTPVFGRAARNAGTDPRDAGRRAMPEFLRKATREALQDDMDRLLAAYRKSDEREQIIQENGTSAYDNGLPTSDAEKLLSYAITAGLPEDQAELLIASWGFQVSSPQNRPT